MYYMGFSYFEAYSVPVWQRVWFIERINKELERTSEAEDTTSKALHHNTPDLRSLQNRGRSQVPARLRRFT